jgi:hypothetical protein
VALTQTVGPQTTAVERILDGVGVPYATLAHHGGPVSRLDAKRYRFTHRPMFEVLQLLGKSQDRFVPRALLQASSDVLSSLLMGLWLGDGSKRGEHVVYTTASKQLAEDVAELGIKLGMGAVIHCRQPRNPRWLPKYDVTLRSAEWYAVHPKRNNVSVLDDWDGDVYCATVPNHTLLVERNGKITWCGNCGPAAAVRFAQAYGRNPTLREATDLAAKVGWTPGQGMAGIDSEQKLLQQLGVPTRLIGADIPAMAHEAQTGNPVTISTPGHYFYADGYNPQTGAFHVGQSGLDLKGGAEWMTPSQMEARMGTIQGALLADNPQAPAVSTAAPITDQLDQTRQTLSAALSSKPASAAAAPPLPRQAMTQFGASPDPRVQQLDQAVQSAAAPSPEVSQRPAYLSLFDTAASRNPLEALGNTIGQAISNALGQAGFGPPGGPPGGGNRRRDEDLSQQDQFSPQAGELGDLTLQPPEDVGTRARRMIEQLQTLPGGAKLGDVVGVPDLLPPDWDKLKGMSVWEALQEAMDRGNQLANLPRPSLGPGGLGIVDPHFGNDPRMDIPDVLDVLGPLGELAGAVTGQTGREAARGVERAASAFDLARGVSPEELRGATSGAVQEAFDAARAAQSPNASVVADIASKGQQSAAEGLSRTAPQSAYDWLVRQYSDRQVDLNQIEQEFARRLGRPLTDSERVGLLNRLDPTHQAETAIENAIGPAIRDIPRSALPDFYDLVKARTNKSTAEGLAKQIEQDVLSQGIAPRTQQRYDEALSGLDQAQQAHAQALADQRAIDVGTHRTQQSISLNAAGERVRAARAAVNDAEETARDAAAAHAHEQALRSPAGELVRRPEQHDLILAESDARRANARYERMAAREPSVPIAPTGTSNAVRRAYEQGLAAQARQVGYAEDRLSRLRQAMGETTVAREAAVGERAGTAAQAARERPYVPPTLELAAARVRLRYEQQNLERLQTARARGQQGLVDDLARAYQKVNKAQRDVETATRDLPEAARAQGWAQLSSRLFEGKTYDQITQDLANLEAKYRDQPDVWQKMQNALQSVKGFREQLLQDSVDHGLITQDQADALLDRYDFWTPTRMLDYMTDEGPTGLPRGSRVNVSSNGFRNYTLEGSNSEQENHIASQIRYAQEHYSRAAKNDVFNALVGAQGGEGGALRRIADDMNEYVASGGSGGRLLPPDYKPKQGQGERKLTGFIDGKKQEYVTSNPYIHAAVEQVGPGDSILAKLLHYPVMLTRETAVSRNPLWLAGNSARDAAAYAIRSTAQGGVRGLPGMAINLAPAALTAATTSNDDPNRGQKIAAALAAGMGTRIGLGKNLGLGPSAAREFLRAYGDVLLGLGSGRMTGEGVQQLMLGGGGMRGGGFHAAGVRGGEEALRRLTRSSSFQIRDFRDLRDLLNDAAAFGWVKALGDRFEQAPRVAMMRQAAQRGESPLESIMRARDASIDFDRGGNFSREVNRILPFFNAGAQGGAQLARLIRQHPLGTAFAGTVLAGLPAAGIEAWNYSDPQRARDYENVPEYIKRQGPVLMLPGEAPRDANGNRVPQHLDFNLQEFAPFAIAGREAYKRITGRGTPRSAGELLGDVAQQESPGNLWSSPSQFVGGLLPPGLGTAVQLEQNQDLFRGSSIANQYSDENASNLGKGLAPILERAVNQIPGFSSARIRPSQIDFALKDTLNGLGQTGLNIADRATGRQPSTPGAPSEIPLIGSGIGRFVRGTGGQAWQDVQQPEQMLAPDVRRQLRSLGGSTAYYEPSVVPSEIKKIPLRREEQAEYQRLTNQYFDQQLRKYMATPSFSGRDLVRQKMIDHAMRAARTRAQTEVLRQIRAGGSNLAQRVKQQSSAY